MKAGDLLVIEFCAKFGSFRTHPLQTSVDLAKHSAFEGDPPRVHGWSVVGFAGSEQAAREALTQLKKKARAARK